MIVERPAVERRILGALEDGRIPVLLGGCAIGRTSLLLRTEQLLGPERALFHQDDARLDLAAGVLGGVPLAAELGGIRRVLDCALAASGRVVALVLGGDAFEQRLVALGPKALSGDLIQRTQ